MAHKMHIVGRTFNWLNSECRLMINNVYLCIEDDAKTAAQRAVTRETRSCEVSLQEFCSPCVHVDETGVFIPDKLTSVCLCVCMCVCVCVCVCPQTGWMMWNWLVSALAVGASALWKLLF